MFFESVCVALLQSFELVWELPTQCDASSLRDSALHWAIMFLLFQSEAFNVGSFRTPNNALKVGNVWIDLILECAKRSTSDRFAHRTML